MNRQIAILAVLGIAAYLLMSSIYTVSEVEQMIITQFGKPVGQPVTSAGLKVKVPFIQEVNPIDKRVLEWDGPPSDMPTKDKLYISVDLFARWRITDPLQYFLRLRDERSAQSRLDDILGSETRNAVAKHELIEIIRTTKDRVPLRDSLLTDTEQEQKMGSLVPIQKGRKLVEAEIPTVALNVAPFKGTGRYQCDFTWLFGMVVSGYPGPAFAAFTRVSVFKVHPNNPESNGKKTWNFWSVVSKYSDINSCPVMLIPIFADSATETSSAPVEPTTASPFKLPS